MDDQYEKLEKSINENIINNNKDDKNNNDNIEDNNKYDL